VIIVYKVNYIDTFLLVGLLGYHSLPL